jgi:hypothetical protein
MWPGRFDLRNPLHRSPRKPRLFTDPAPTRYRRYTDVMPNGYFPAFSVH